ncbi:Ig-like domain-containing protein [Streptococcus infantis]|uniref:Ig-like domain-containing protein n=1 Tax=Streptococcus infantis TaxID=68892 RepID=UPI0039C09EC0
MKISQKSVTRLLAFVSIFVLSLVTLTTVFGAEVTNYTNNTSITLDGKPITADTKVGRGQAMEATNSITFPDSQAINAGDTLVLELPKALNWPVKSEFPIKNGSEIIGNAVADPTTGKTTVTFTDYFSKNPQNKRMSLKYDIVINAENVTKSGPQTFKYGEQTYNLTYDPDSTAIGQYEYKYGYQDPQNPKQIKWRVILNAGQDQLNGLQIKDELADGQVLIEKTLRAVRYATQPKAIESEEQLTKLDPTDNFTKKAVFTKNAEGKITGFTFNFGDNYKWPIYIEYTTELTETKKKGDVVNNVVKWTAKNFPKERSYPAKTLIYTASGEGEGETTTSTTTTTTTTTESTTTSTTTTTSEEPTTTSTTTTTSEEPTTTSTTTTTSEESTTTSTTTTTSEESTTTSTTTTTSEEPTTTSTTTTTTSEESTTTSTTTTTSEESTTTSTTTTTSEESTTTSTTTTTSEEPTTTSTTTTTSEEPSTTSTTTTTTSEEPSTTSTTTTTTSEEPSTTSTTTTTTSEEPSTTSTTTTTTEEPVVTETTVTPENQNDKETTTTPETTTPPTPYVPNDGPTTTPEPTTPPTPYVPNDGPTSTTTEETSEETSETTEGTSEKPAPSVTTTEDKPGLPFTGEATGATLVLAGVVILSGTVVMKRKFSK